MHPALQRFIIDLEQLSPNDDDQELAYKLHELTSNIEGYGAALDVVPHIFSFFERYPNADHGTPGALVHYVEKLYPAYLPLLISSVARKPTPHTLWMVNRILNANIDQGLRVKLLGILEKSTSHPLVDDRAKQEAANFFRCQLEKAG